MCGPYFFRLVMKTPGMTKDEYILLYQKSLQGKCTPEEIEELNQYEDDFEWIEADTANQEQADRIYANLLEEMQKQQQPGFVFNWKKLSAAAAILVFVTLSIFIGLRQKTSLKSDLKTAKQALPIQPGTTKATLILGDGSTVNLNDASNGQIASENGTAVIKKEGGELAYNVLATTPDEIIFNTISIPRGGQYNLTLPDGSKVWLNADSKLRFPTRFVGNSREVELDGEAYFEVAANKKMPFYVAAGGMKVKVLGTHFNVMAYSDEPFVKTTLLEGRVMLSSAGANAYLKPGEQGVFTANKFGVSKADIDQEMAWKNGYFIFNGESLSAVMRKVSRWYDVEVSYSTHNNNLTYTGSVSKFKNISEVLKVLSLTGTVKFNVQERRVTVIN